MFIGILAAPRPTSESAAIRRRSSWKCATREREFLEEVFIYPDRLSLGLEFRECANGSGSLGDRLRFVPGTQVLRLW